MSLLESLVKTPVNVTSWTEEMVKDCLPVVKVEIKGKVFPALTSGRKNRFCGVYVPQTEHRLEFSWGAVVRSLNTETPLLI